MKRITAMLIAVLLLQGLAFGIGVGDIAKIQAGKLASTLQLTDEQTGKVEEIIRSELLRLQAANDMTSDDPRETMDRTRLIQTEARTSISELLTDEQSKAMESAGWFSILPGMQMLRLNEELDLTAAQYESIDSIYSLMRPQGEPRSGGRGGRGDRQPGDRREQMQRANEAIMKLLTDEQQKKFQEMMEERQNRGRPLRRQRGSDGGFPDFH